MDLIFSFMVWTLLLVFAYFFCTNLGEYSAEDGEIFPPGAFFDTLEKVGFYLSMAGLFWLTGSIVWMIVLAYQHGAIAKIFGY